MALPIDSHVLAEPGTVPMRLLPDHLMAIGEPVATTERICALVGRPPRSIQDGLSRLRRQGRLFSPARGLYVAVPPQYRSWGVVPAMWFIDPMMRHLGRNYYVGLLTAAAIHSAAHQSLQVFQVMVDRQLDDRELGRVRLRFHVAARLQTPQHVPTVEVTTQTGTMTVASPELVVVDTVTDPDASGGLDNVATILVELPELDVDVLTTVCADASRAVVRRIGWLLERIVGMGELDRLRELAAPHSGDPTPLDVHGPRAGIRDRDWGVIVNADVDEES
jgi:predicted transcriptional regulator of viral defense system